MATKLWQKKEINNIEQSKLVEEFTVGNDKLFDILLAKYDVQASLAHAKMLTKINLLSSEELQNIEWAFLQIMNQIESNEFLIEEGIEDVHSQIEFQLIQLIGETGKKIHCGRSRNDQVLVAIKLFLKNELIEIAKLTKNLFEQFQFLSEKNKNVLLPGYTHLQVAMPTSFGLWFGAYAESLVDDLEIVSSSFQVVNKNPLGSAAGYGSSFPINRNYTTELLNFQTLNYNVVYAQMTRGKSEKSVAIALSTLASTMSKFAYDVCLYMSQNFNFISFPESLTTGSSIMPHKKNPDVFELIRAKCNLIQSVPNQLTMLLNNLPSGYHRDTQLTKEILFPSIQETKKCLKMLRYVLEYIEVHENILEDEKYKYLFTVEAVNKLVLSGTPFRDAYKEVGLAVENEEFLFEGNIQHTHLGSIGNLGNEQIKKEFNKVYEKIVEN